MEAMTETSGAPEDVATLSFEQARDELVRVVAELEQGAPTLEHSLALWERGEALAARCEEWLLGAKRRLEAARATVERGDGGPRIVAELGRPETPEETADRKAESSRVYRSSQNVRNLVAALLATLAIVVVIIFAVPRGTPPAREPIDVAAVAESISASEGRTVITPEMSDGWVVNNAGIEGNGSVRAFTVIYAPAGEDERGFLRVAQGFDADEAWAARVLSGSAPQDTVVIDGITWERYDLDPDRTGNITVALATDAGTDTVLIYGAAAEKALEETARSVTDQITALREEAE
jgi:exodeoxyribonuclease VII small subunit